MQQQRGPEVISRKIIMESTNQIKAINQESEIELCWEVAHLLRPHLKKENWLPSVSEMMKNEKYHIAAIFDNDKIIAFAGYREMTSLHSGNIFYIDDLCTLLPYRKRGLGTQLLNHINLLAKNSKKDAVVLDTGHSNSTAQKLYLNNGFKLVAFHLVNLLNQ